MRSHTIKSGCFHIGLGVAGVELTFLTVVHMVLCFTFMAKAVPVTPPFWLLLGSACTALRFCLFLAQGCTQGWEQKQPGQLTPSDQSN